MEIFKYCGLWGNCSGKNSLKKGLLDLLAKYSENVKLSKNQEEKKIKTEEADKLYDDEIISIIRPNTCASALFYGKGTKWCTTSQNKSNFEDYVKQGPLYIIIPKSPVRTDEKYQFHLNTSSFNNEFDQTIDISDYNTRSKI
jgi:hypothetical protein